ncbi:MAG: imidazolonepropionase [Pseudomonadota bacterium]
MRLIDCTVATMAGPAYGLIADAAVAIEGDRIAAVGPKDTVTGGPDVSLGGALVTPALIDCHTHVVHGGHRAGEFERRLNGATYEELARAGGGIASTMAATRAASVDDLVAAALPRVDALMAEGVATLEIKSGYGLDQATELAMLRAARAIGRARPLTVVTTFLGAHAIPPTHKGEPGRYLNEVCLPALRAAHAEGLVDAVDGFCEGVAFTADEMARVFDLARALGLPVKLHAEQLSHTGGTALAARFGALSADHLEHATEADAKALAAAGTVAVILPGAYYTLGQGAAPPIAAFREHGTAMAVATDCNPGSSPLTSLLLAMNMAATLFRLTPEEALAGTTRHAARALGFADRGTIETGKRADLAVWRVTEPAELTYRIGFNPLSRAMVAGQWR